jgi:hypothetical protein
MCGGSSIHLQKIFFLKSIVAPVQHDKRIALPPDLEHVKGIAKLQQYRSSIPAVTHVDYSARLQSVDAERHGLFHTLMQTFYQKSDCPVLINTSFNLGWDPIVCSPQDAYETFMASDIDVLCMGHYVLTKSAQPAYVSPVAVDSHDEVMAKLLCSPCHGASLDFAGTHATCTQCGHVFHKEDGIWLMFWPHEHFNSPGDVTEQVKTFYEQTPFPNYDDRDSVQLLIDKARKGGYAQALNRAIPYNSTVLEVGCGTGQLSNFLGVSCQRVIGVDLCLNSLRLGEQFRDKHGLNRVRFTQMNLFRPCFKPEQFDVILCNGVLDSVG